MTYYPNQAGESSDTTCVSEGRVGCAHELRRGLHCLTGRKQAGRRALRSAGWLQGVCRALYKGSPVWKGKRSECEMHDPPGEPGAGKRHARFGGQEVETDLREPD